MREFYIGKIQNTNLYNPYNHSKIYQIEDTYFIDGYVGYSAINNDANLLYTKKMNDSAIFSLDGEYAYYSNTNSNKIELYKIEIKTGKTQVYNFSIDSSSYVNTYLNIYINEHGIVIPVSIDQKKIYYLVDKELQNHNIVDKTYAYNSYNMPKKNTVSNEILEKLTDFLLSKNVISSQDDILHNEFVTYDSQYFGIIKENNNYIIVYTDKDMKEYKTISLGTNLNAEYIEDAEIFSQEDGIVTFVMAGKTYCPMEISYEECGPTYIMQKIVPLYNVLTKTDNNGQIKAISSAKAGEGVTFEIIPNKGFVLGTVKVTDAQGKILKFTNNRFTMPTSNVIIEATFLPENPETKINNFHFIFLLIIILLIIISILKSFQKKFMKI